VTATIKGVGKPQGIAVTGLTSPSRPARVIVANAAGAATLIDPTTNQVIGKIVLGGEPTHVAWVAQGGRIPYVYVTFFQGGGQYHYAGDVALLDYLNRQLADIVNVGPAPDSLAVTPDSSKLVVGTSGTIEVIDIATNSITSTIAFPGNEVLGSAVLAMDPVPAP
jgi:DNA-binding beta-propeller fold protein YncE